VSASFAEVESAMARADPPAVEQLAETLMRPMVKAWLDENLPPLVERIVREEIERVARKR
jgi:cell pole-organizing protein PopZ